MNTPSPDPPSAPRMQGCCTVKSQSACWHQGTCVVPPVCRPRIISSSLCLPILSDIQSRFGREIPVYVSWKIISHTHFCRLDMCYILSRISAHSGQRDQPQGPGPLSLGCCPAKQSLIHSVCEKKGLSSLNVFGQKSLERRPESSGHHSRVQQNRWAAHQSAELQTVDGDDEVNVPAFLNSMGCRIERWCSSGCMAVDDATVLLCGLNTCKNHLFISCN